MKRLQKYENTFSEFKDYLLVLGLLQEKKTSGLTLSEIKKLEVDLDLNFDECLTAYLKIFGNWFRQNLLVNEFQVFSKRTITRAIEEFDNCELDQLILSCKNFNTLGIARSDINRIIPIFYIDYSACFQFVIEGIEDPYLYTIFEGDIYEDDNLIISDKMRISDSIRNEIFLRLYYHCRLGGDSDISFSKINKIEWMSVYRYIIEKDLYSRYELLNLRKLFSEKKNMKFSTIDQFENEFVKFLIEEKGIVYLRSQYNPYNKSKNYKTSFE